MTVIEGTDAITNGEDVIDSRDVIARIAYLRDAWAESTGDDPDGYALSEDDWALGLGDDDAAEMVALLAFAEQASDYASDWQYGEALIRDDYFEDYARQLAEDIGAIPDDAGWPCTCIDWEQAARELRMDYTPVEFGGVTYWTR